MAHTFSESQSETETYSDLLILHEPINDIYDEVFSNGEVGGTDTL